MKKPIILYPFLFAMYPILFLYSHNIEELMFSDVQIPLAVAFLASILVYGVVRVITKERATSALITAVAVAFFFLYGMFFDAISYLGTPARDRYLLPSFLLGELVLIAVIFKARKRAERASFGTRSPVLRSDTSPERSLSSHVAQRILPVLNSISVILVLLSLFNVATFTVKDVLSASPKNANQQKNLSGTAAKPDIYYIILDEYLRSDKMEEIYGYDNAEFTDFLEQRGFFIAKKSESHVGSTLYSLASSLNMELVPPLETELSEAMKMIQNNKVSDFLKAQGYKTVIFNNSNSTTGKAIADYDFSYDGSASAQKINFYQIITKNSMVKPFFSTSASRANPVFALSRGTTLFTLSKILDLDDVPSPKFVFAHFVSPHVPFVFNRKGGFVDPSHEDDWENKKYYLDQYIFMNDQVQKIVDQLLEQHKDNPPVIIIQSDHGIRKNYLWEGKKKSISYIGMDTWKYIFNAYYLPGFTGVIPSDMSPAQTFKLVFSHYFH